MSRLDEIEQMEPTPNAWANRFKALVFGGEQFDALYQWQAERAGLKYGPKSKLSPHILTEATPITINDPLHIDIPVSLSATTPSRELRFYFQDPAFVRRATSTVIGARLTAAGQPDQLFENSIDPRDYIYAQLKREGAGDTFMTDFMPLSEFTGPGMHAYFWNLVPAVRQAETLLLTLTLTPPGYASSQAPPFVDHIGQVVVSFHTERLAAWGI